MEGSWREVERRLGGKVNTSHFAMTPCGKQGFCGGARLPVQVFICGKSSWEVGVDFHIYGSAWVEGGDHSTSYCVVGRCSGYVVG